MADGRVASPFLNSANAIYIIEHAGMLFGVREEGADKVKGRKRKSLDANKEAGRRFEVGVPAVVRLGKSPSAKVGDL